jgi:predicted short-subunit dehydrogenase-like oxidoreductase (DUF2520 family)
MDAETVSPEAQAEKVLEEVRKRAAIPLLEIPAVTGVRGADLDKALQKLERDQLVDIKESDDRSKAIVAIKDPR